MTAKPTYPQHIFIQVEQGFFNDFDSQPSEVRLWISVLLQAFRDAYDLVEQINRLKECLGDAPIQMHYKTQAHTILRDVKSDHFKWICNIVNVDFELCKKKITDIFESSRFKECEFTLYTDHDWKCLLIKCNARFKDRKRPTINRNYGLKKDRHIKSKVTKPNKDDEFLRRSSRMAGKIKL